MIWTIIFWWITVTVLVWAFLIYTAREGEDE